MQSCGIVSAAPPLHRIAFPSAAGAARAGEDDDAGLLGIMRPSSAADAHATPDRPNAALLSPLVPHSAAGLAYGAPVACAISAPRSWFVDGGEGDGADLALGEADSAAASSATAGAAAAGDDLFGGGSLTDFAARIAGGDSKARAKGPAAAGAAEAAAKLSASGLPVRRGLAGWTAPPAVVDAVVYVQVRPDVITAI